MVGLNVVINLTGKVIIAGAAFIAVPIYIKYVGKESYSLISILTTIQAIFILLDGGISAGYLKRMAYYQTENNKKREQYYLSKTTELLFIVFSLVILFTLLSLKNELVYSWLDVPLDLESATIEVFSIISFIVSAKFLILFYVSSLKSCQKFITLNFISTFFTIFKFSLSIYLLQFESSVELIFKVYLLSVICELCVAKYFSNKQIDKFEYSFKEGVKELKSIGGFIGIMALVSLTSAILSQMDKVIISSNVTLLEYSYYAVASLVASVPLLISSPMSGAIYPRLVQVVAEGKKVAIFYNRFSSLIAIVIFPLVSYYAFNAIDLLEWWTSDIEIAQKSSKVSILLILGSTILSIMSMPYFLCLSYDLVRIPLVANLIAIALTIPIISLLLPIIGITAGGITWLLINMILMVFFMIKMKNLDLKISIKNWLKTNSILFVCSMVFVYVLDLIFKESVLSHVIVRGVAVVFLFYCVFLKLWTKKCYFQ